MTLYYASTVIVFYADLFTLQPKSQDCIVGQIVQFQCQPRSFLRSGYVIWYNESNSMFLRNSTKIMFYRPNSTVAILNITCDEDFDQSEISCWYIDDNNQFQKSRPVALLIVIKDSQGNTNQELRPIQVKYSFHRKSLVQFCSSMALIVHFDKSKSKVTIYRGMHGFLTRNYPRKKKLLHTDLVTLKLAAIQKSKAMYSILPWKCQNLPWEDSLMGRTQCNEICLAMKMLWKCLKGKPKLEGNWYTTWMESGWPKYWSVALLPWLVSNLQKNNLGYGISNEAFVSQHIEWLWGWETENINCQLNCYTECQHFEMPLNVQKWQFVQKSKFPFTKSIATCWRGLQCCSALI